MKILFDLFPIVLFFITYRVTGDIYIATSVTMLANGAQIAFVWWRHRQVDTLLWVSFVLVIVLGSATLLFRDQRFIYWKPTAVYWLMAIGLVLAKAIKKHNPIKQLMAAQLTLPEPIWTRLYWAWIVFFGLMGGLNLWVAFTFTESFWVNFKLFGTLGITLVFIAMQTLALAKYLRK